MITAEQSRHGVTLLQFLRVIPSSAWLRASILWADDLAAMWPMREPTPLDQAQEQPLQEVWSLLNAGLFERKYLYDFFSHMTASAMAQALDEAESARASKPHPEGWEDGGPAVGPDLVPAGPDHAEYDPDTFLYPDKLPEAMTRELARRHLIRPRPDGRGYTAASAEFLNRLLAGYARVLQARSGGYLLPDVEEPGQARRIAAPLNTGETRQALVLTLRGGVAPDLQTDFQRFIDFRAVDKNERARRDYIGQLTSLWDLCARGGPEHAHKQVLGRVAADLGKARESYFKRVTAQALMGQALTSFSVLIPLAAAHPPAAVVGALTAIAGSAVTVAVRNDAPRYIRRATQSELLAPTAL
jgi:hypothetical protein